MKEPVVADTSCLIGLERIGRLELLPALFEPVLIPPAVAAEFGFGPGWLRVETPVDRALVTALGLLVDRGEAEAIALGSERGLRLLLDDRQARNIAGRMGLAMLGAVGVLLRAKQAGILPAVRPELEALEESGFYLAAALRAEVLKLAGE